MSTLSVNRRYEFVKKAPFMTPNEIDVAYSSYLTYNNVKGSVFKMLMAGCGDVLDSFGDYEKEFYRRYPNDPINTSTLLAFYKDELITPREQEVGTTSATSPSHYKEHPSGVECIIIAQAFTFNLGNVIKYLWRAGLKSENPIEDLEKAKVYLQFEIDRLNGKVEPRVM